MKQVKQKLTVTKKLLSPREYAILRHVWTLQQGEIDTLLTAYFMLRCNVQQLDSVREQAAGADNLWYRGRKFEIQELDCKLDGLPYETELLLSFRSNLLAGFNVCLVKERPSTFIPNRNIEILQLKECGSNG